MKTLKKLITPITVAVMLSSKTNAQRPAPAAPDHDNVRAVQAVVLSANSSVHIQDDNSGATVQGDFVPESRMDRQWGEASVWHAFTLTERSNLTIDLAGTEFVQPGAFFDGLLVEPVETGNIITADALYLSAAEDGNYAMTFLALFPGTYYLPIGRIPSVAEGRYALTLSTTPYPGEVVTR